MGKINPVVADVNLTLMPGVVLGLAGESGSGKSTTALAAIGYRSANVEILSGKAIFDGRDLLSAPRSELRTIWGKDIAFVAQDSYSALNPATTIGHQFIQTIRRHLALSGAEAKERCLELLEAVGIPNPELAIHRYSYQFSGGQLQRICIAIAMSCNPRLLLLDEPTSGLDVTTQAKVSALLRDLVKRYNVATLYVSHDLALLRDCSDELAVMYNGRVVELGKSQAVVAKPEHPYTRALIKAVPSVRAPTIVEGIPGQTPSGVVTGKCSFSDRCERVRNECLAGDIADRPRDGEGVVKCLFPVKEPLVRLHFETANCKSAEAALPVLSVKELSCHYPGRREPAVKQVSLTLQPREIVGIVGESGSGKSTLLRAIAGLQPYAGAVEFEGERVDLSARRRPISARTGIQVIFQNPDTSLNPRHTIFDLIRRPLVLARRGAISREEQHRIVTEAVRAVSLPNDILDRYPSELSGGQKQRVAIARAFAPKPKVVLCDEITSALDVSVQANVLKLLRELASEYGTAMIFVSHNLAVIRSIADQSIVMQNGVVVEQRRTDDLFSSPSNKYSQELLSSIPDLESQVCL